jgi:hypothetical protein
MATSGPDRENGRPLDVQHAGRAHEILTRRIGANEAERHTICRGFVEAQQTTTLPKFMTTQASSSTRSDHQHTGKHDGLYWQNPDGSPGGSVSVEMPSDRGRARSTGNRFPRLLFSQGAGAAAPLADSLCNRRSHDRRLCALATPAEYRVTGVKTFMVDCNGIVYQKDRTDTSTSPNGSCSTIPTRPGNAPTINGRRYG